MKIQEYGATSEDYRQRLTIQVDGKNVASFCDGEPEDSNLRRDFRDCYKITELMRMAYEAGKKGEELEIRSTKIDWYSDEDEELD